MRLSFLHIIFLITLRIVPFEKIDKYAEIVPNYEVYLVFTFVFVSLFVGLVIYRHYLDKAHRKIDELLVDINNQTEKFSQEMFHLDFEIQLSKIREKYPLPQSCWMDYKLLKRYISPWLYDWVCALENLKLSETENKYCIYSLIYSSLSMRDLANYLNYSYEGLRVLKSRLIKKIGIPSSSDLTTFLKCDLQQRR